MKKIYLFENQHALDLEPLSLTRPTFDLRCGPLTLLERIQKIKNEVPISLFVRDEISEITKEKHPSLTVNPKSTEDGIWLLGNVLWTEENILEIEKSSNTLFTDKNGLIVAAHLSAQESEQWLKNGGPLSNSIPQVENSIKLGVTVLSYLWNFIQSIPEAIQYDKQFFEIGVNKGHQDWINSDQIYIDGHDSIMPGVIIDASEGPVVLGKDVQISSFSYLKGPLFIGDNSIVQPHSQIKQSVFGPQCRISGELSNVIFQGYSNKAHYGFLGNAYLGEWVNLGAGTTNSNLKNTYESVAVRVNDRTVDTQSIFIGSFIGDHTKTAIGTLLNTGTTIGPGCNIVSNGFPRRSIPALTWYINGKLKNADVHQFLQTADVVMKRRDKNLSESEKQLFVYLNNKK